jgi:hypothetical protein
MAHHPVRKRMRTALARYHSPHVSQKSDFAHYTYGYLAVFGHQRGHEVRKVNASG